MPTNAQAQRGGRPVDPSRALGLAQAFDLYPPRPDELATARALAAAKISDAIVTEAAFAAVQAVTELSLFVHREDGIVTGVLAFFFLNAAGLTAIENETFNPGDVDLALLARPGEAPVGAYAWGFAASTERGGRAVVKGSAALLELLYWNIPVYTRAATPDGERVILGSLGFVRAPGSDPTLTMRPGRDAPLTALAS